MMVGEMDFSDMFAQHVTKVGIVPTFHMPYPVFTTIYFLVFVAMISILLMNLLVGVAIDNVTGVEDSAIIDRLAMQAKLSLDFEFLMPKSWQEKWIEESYSITDEGTENEKRGQIVKPNKASTLFGDVVDDNGTLRRIAKKVEDMETNVSITGVRIHISIRSTLLTFCNLFPD